MRRRRQTREEYQESLERQRRYYESHREEILAKAAISREKERETRKLQKLRKGETNEEFLLRWNEALRKRLDENNFDEDWMRYAVQMQIRFNENEIGIHDDENDRETDKED